MLNRKEIEQLVREKLVKALHTEPLTEETNSKPGEKALDFINEEIINTLERNQVVLIKPGAIITPSARDKADYMGIEFRISLGEEQLIEDDISFPNAIAIGADHGGFELKEEIKKKLDQWGYKYIDVGTHNSDSVDYPDFAYAVAISVAKGQTKKGIMIDGAGIGSAMVANKVKGIRAANCHNLFEINNSREHNDANVLTLGGRTLGPALALEMVKVWLETPFAGGRHQRRVDKIMQYE